MSCGSSGSYIVPQMNRAMQLEHSPHKPQTCTQARPTIVGQPVPRRHGAAARSSQETLARRGVVHYPGRREDAAHRRNHSHSAGRRGERWVGIQLVLDGGAQRLLVYQDGGDHDRHVSERDERARLQIQRDQIALLREIDEHRDNVDVEHRPFRKVAH
eukprot:4184692-Prymnesium_polylepis.1